MKKRVFFNRFHKENLPARLPVVQGFSLGELLIVVLIVTLLAIAIIMAYQNQIAKARDTQRKEHLNKFRIAFEDYYNDKGCYPSVSMWNDVCQCVGDVGDGSTCLAPYMNEFLCDPTTRQPYYYTSVIDGSSDTCLGYRLFTKLENKGDPDIIAVGCSPVIGCGTGDLANYNWGINLGGSLTAADFNPNATPTPTTVPSQEMGNNFCLGGQEWKKTKDIVCNQVSGCASNDTQDPKRACNVYLVEEKGCQSFVDPDTCQAQCRADYSHTQCAATLTVLCEKCQ